MGFFIKAVALAFSIIASVFAGTDAPKAMAKEKPVVASRQSSLSAPANLVSTKETADPRIVRVLFIRSRAATTSPDPESERFLALVRSRPSVKHQPTGLPWYATYVPSNGEQVKTAVDVFRALVTGDQNDY